MKKYFLLLFLLMAVASFSQSVKTSFNAISPSEKAEKKMAFQHGEWLKFRLSYSNFLNAGFSTIEVKEIKNKGLPAFHITGNGKSTGLVSLFFKVKDDYQTYMYKESLKPYRFIRKIDEGGYTKDQEIHFLGKEVLKTKFGKINTLVFRPMVQAGRVFKEQESLTIWVSDDQNKIPLRIKANLAVGSLRADLDAFKGLAHPFNIIFNN